MNKRIWRVVCILLCGCMTVLLLEFLRRTRTVETAAEFAFAEQTLDRLERRHSEIDRGLLDGRIVAIRLPSSWIQAVDERIVSYANSNRIKILQFEMRAGVTEVCVWAEDADRMRAFVKTLSNRR